jgi:hypothetical protein
MHPAADKISYSSFAEYFRHMYPRWAEKYTCCLHNWAFFVKRVARCSIVAASGSGVTGVAIC